MSKSDKKAKKAEFQQAMSRLEEAVKELGDAAKDNFADRAAEVLEQTAAKLKSEVSRSKPAKFESGRRSESGVLGHWRPEGAPRPFRDLDNGRLWGICAGMAPYLGLEVWVVRCLAVTAFIFAPSVTIPAYIIGYFVLDARSELDELVAGDAPNSTPRMRKRYARNERHAAKAEARAAKREQRKEKYETKRNRRDKKSSVASEPVLPARNVLRSVRGTLNEAELRLRRMEGHVTSGRYELQKELRKIDTTT